VTTSTTDQTRKATAPSNNTSGEMDFVPPIKRYGQVETT
jgi:hypothetical protein